jgi:hypothetical protein
MIEVFYILYYILFFYKMEKKSGKTKIFGVVINRKRILVNEKMRLPSFDTTEEDHYTAY